MNDRFFLDTNIFVDSFDRAWSAKCRIAQELTRRAIATGKGIVSYQVVQEFFNVALRHFAQLNPLADAEQYLSITFRPLITVYPSVGLYGEALRLQKRHSVSWYDSLIIASAVEGQCSVLFSEDFQDGRKFGSLTVRNPFAGT
jgi:predicted nucleic acid-binding protein